MNSVGLDTGLASLTIENNGLLLFDMQAVLNRATELRVRGIRPLEWALFLLASNDFSTVLSMGKDAVTVDDDDDDDDDDDAENDSDDSGSDGRLRFFDDDPYGMAAEFKGLVGRWWDALEAMQEDEDVAMALMVVHSEVGLAPFDSRVEVLIA
jgi:hypothetical protein